MLHFHFCSKYIQNVASSAVDKAVRKKLNEYSKRSTIKGINSIASYTGRIFVLNITNPHYKIILEERRDLSAEENSVAYFVRDIIGMGQNYHWLQNYVAIRNGKWLEYWPLPQLDIKNYKIAIIGSHSETVKDQPPLELTKWHQDYKLHVEYDIYETEEWVRFALSNSIAEGMKDDEVKVFKLALSEMVKDGQSLAKKEILISDDYYCVVNLELNDICIIYTEYLFANHDKSFFLLHNGGNIKTQSAYVAETQSRLLPNFKACINLEDLQRIAVRAYPSWTLNNPDLWKDIQKNSETGNLSLLPEQTKFLKEFTFPKYINGQAGSGKSTMLYYLFANSYYYKCLGEISGDLIFLTENEKLLEHTRSAVVELLQCNPEFELSTEDVSNVFDHFVSFKRFLLRLLPEEVIDFPQDKYLDFSKFKIKYEESNIAFHIKAKYSAEFAWFAISTYIYGYDFDVQITSVNYDQLLPTDGKELLKKEDLIGIEKDILGFYNKLIYDEGYWDKIKIIKYIKNNVTITKEYDVIFCDEAQDFSRVELRFILSLSKYINYDLSLISQVPIVFAGDALQTVNPTGFRPAEVKDMLYRELKEIAGFKLDTNKIEYTPYYNYRSSQQIVNIANAIQYYRKTEFKSDIKKPQIAKRIEAEQDSNLNVFIDYHALDTSSELKRKLEHKTFIIPINPDEKDAYISKHDVLSNFSNIKSAVEAKGIDYEQVVLFGFGEYATNNTNIEDYERRFFYNKLYVAVTRAQAELVIIDSKSSEDLFWKPLIDRYANSDWSTISEIEKGNIQDTICFGSDQIPNILQSTPEMAMQNAFKDKAKATFDRNPFLLRVAANQFLKLGDRKNHFICLGLMHEFQEKWKEAASFYLRKEVGNEGRDYALNAYWNGHVLDNYMKLSTDNSDDIHKIRIIIINLIVEKNISESNLDFLYNKRIELKKIIREATWHNEIVNGFCDFLHNVVDEDQIRILIDIFHESIPIHDKRLWFLVGKKNYLLRRYEYAIEIFDKISESGFYYIKSNIELSLRKKKFAETIIWLGEMIEIVEKETEKQFHENSIIELYQKHSTQVDEIDQLDALVQTYFAYLSRLPYDPILVRLAKTVEAGCERKQLSNKYGKLLFSGRLSVPIAQFVATRLAKNMFEVEKNISRVNDLMKQFVNFSIEPFTSEEIEKIEKIPSFIHPDFPKHFKNITIQNFKALDNVRIENFGQFNLIVGDNNVGKTTLLEALLFTPDLKLYLQRLAYTYISRRNVIPDKEENSEGIRPFYKLDRSFLNDIIDTNDIKSTIKFVITEKRFTWKYCLTQEPNDGVSDQFLKMGFSETDYKIFDSLPYLDNIKQPFIPFGKGFDGDLAQLYFDEVTTKPIVEEAFLKNMKVFIPNIIRVIPDTGGGTIEILEGDSLNKLRKLHQYGEGTNKLFRILVLLTIHRGKYILIDEIDSGIHFSKFKEFWRILITVANQDGTQIFATTHNEECIEYFSEVLESTGKEIQSKSRVVQAKRINDSIKIRCYPFNSFNQALNDNFEIRGGDIS